MDDISKIFLSFMNKKKNEENSVVTHAEEAKIVDAVQKSNRKVDPTNWVLWDINMKPRQLVNLGPI